MDNNRPVKQTGTLDALDRYVDLEADEDQAIGQEHEDDSGDFERVPQTPVADHLRLAATGAPQHDAITRCTLCLRGDDQPRVETDGPGRGEAGFDRRIFRDDQPHLQQSGGRYATGDAKSKTGLRRAQRRVRGPGAVAV